MLSCNRLDWDSDFFNLEVYKVTVPESGKFDLSQLPSNALTYIFSSGPLEIECQLVDQKLTFAASTENSEPIPLQPPGQSVTYTEPILPTEQEAIFELSILASHQSRFRVDQKMKSKKVDELYQIWCQKALSQPQNFKMIVAKVNAQIAGMCVLKFTKNLVVIDLISVFEKFQGNGIGSGLITRAYQEAQKRKILQIEVTTQASNSSACKLYEKMGMKRNSLTYIYHAYT